VSRSSAKAFTLATIRNAVASTSMRGQWQKSVRQDFRIGGGFISFEFAHFVAHLGATPGRISRRFPPIWGFLKRTGISGRRRHPPNERASQLRLSRMKMSGPALMNRCLMGKTSADRHRIGAPIMGGKWVYMVALALQSIG